MSLKNRDALLGAIAQSALRLLETTDWEIDIQDILKLMGEATNASHAYLFINHLDAHQKLVTSQKYEWTGPGQKTEITNPDFQNVPVFEEGLTDWYAKLAAGKPFYNTTKIFQEDWADTLSRMDIKTLLDVPIFVDGKWWGVIGFDDCMREMAWSQGEVDAMQAVAGMLGAAIKRQQTDDALRASEKKFHTTFHHTFVPMVISTALDRNILDVNNAFCDQFGYIKSEVVGHKAGELKLWAREEEYLQHREILKSQRMIREFKAQFRHKSGEIGTVLVSAVSITINHEECLLYSLHDVTNSEMLLVELQNKNNELERFTYTVSHDLKAPLITIGGFVGYLAKDLTNGNSVNAKRDIERIMNAVQKMQRLLDELLELSRIGRLVNQKENVELSEIAKDAVQLLQGRLMENNIKVKIDKDLPAVYGDRTRLVQVIQNLVDNSAKFMGAQSNPVVEIGVTTIDHENAYFVRDNGIGIEAKYIDRIFGLFEKLNAETEGTGIGLAMAKRIIEFHGGKIWASSEGKNRGTTFYFTLPNEIKKINSKE